MKELKAFMALLVAPQKITLFPRDYNIAFSISWHNKTPGHIVPGTVRFIGWGHVTFRFTLKTDNLEFDGFYHFNPPSYFKNQVNLVISK